MRKVIKYYEDDPAVLYPLLAVWTFWEDLVFLILPFYILLNLRVPILTCCVILTTVWFILHIPNIVESSKHMVWIIPLRGVVFYCLVTSFPVWTGVFLSILLHEVWNMIDCFVEGYRGQKDRGISIEM